LGLHKNKAIRTWAGKKIRENPDFSAAVVASPFAGQHSPLHQDLFFHLRTANRIAYHGPRMRGPMNRREFSTLLPMLLAAPPLAPAAQGQAAAPQSTAPRTLPKLERFRFKCLHIHTRRRSLNIRLV
jgi:hypothetical protein